MKDGTTYRHNIIAVAGVVMIAVGLIGAAPGAALADPPGYVFRKLAAIPGTAPGGGQFAFDFEPYAINAAGDVAFVADLDTGAGDAGEGVFITRQGRLSQVVRLGQTVGGHLLDSSALGHSALNNGGDGAFVYVLDPFTTPLGLNAGLFRFSLKDLAPIPVVVPGVTSAPVPTGAVFAGVYFNTSMNNRGDAVFNGVVPGLAGPPASVPFGVGVGVFKADRWNRITKIVAPGDNAPGGGVFDDAIEGWTNDSGDIAFDAHVKGEECIDLSGGAGGYELVCGSSVYKLPKNGTIESVAHQGDPAPGGFTYRQAFGPVMNDAGDLVFVGDLLPPPPDNSANLGVFRHAKGKTTSVALPGDPLPGGGHFKTTASIPYQYYLNNAGDITFLAELDTGNTDNEPDTGMYLFSHGKIRVVARSGTDIPGIGTVAHVNSQGLVGKGGLQAGGIINDRGQIFFEVVLTDGTGALLVATPRGK